MNTPFLQSPVLFPNPETADSEGILAVGADLKVETLIQAYSMGIFPWFSEYDPYPVWWSPPERMVLVPGEHKVSKSMNQVLRKNPFTFTLDLAFEQVIQHCAEVYREDQGGTWITQEMIEAYVELHKHGYAHSAEIWSDGRLVGGLYGVSLGKIFCGESMFSLLPNASKFAFIKLSDWLKNQGFILLDCQNYTAHLESMGAALIPRKDYLNILAKATKIETLRGKWLVNNSNTAD